MFKNILNRNTIFGLIGVGLLLVNCFLLLNLFYFNILILIAFEVLIILFITLLVKRMIVEHRYYNKIFQFENPELIEKQFVFEKSNGKYVEFGKIVITKNFIYTKQHGFGIHRLSNLMMAHKKQAIIKTYSFNTSRMCLISLYYADNTIDEVTITNEEVTKLLDYFKAHCPSVVLGYRPAVVTKIKKLNRFKI